MTPPDTQNESATREEIDKKLEAAGWVIQDKKRFNSMESTGVAVRDKFEGQQICDDESYPKGQAAWTQPDQAFDEGNAFRKKITYKVGKKTVEETITNFPEASLVAHQCAAKGRAPGMARDKTERSLIRTVTGARPEPVNQAQEVLNEARRDSKAQHRKYLMRPEQQHRKCLMNTKRSEVKPEGVLKGKSRAYCE